LHRDNLIDLEDLSKEDIKEFFNYSKINKIPKNKFNDVFISFINENKTVDQIIVEKSIFKDLENIDPKAIARDVIKNNSEQVLKLKKRSIGLLMGRFMAKSKGLVDGKIASKILSEELDRFLNQ